MSSPFNTDNKHKYTKYYLANNSAIVKKEDKSILIVKGHEYTSMLLGIQILATIIT